MVSFDFRAGKRQMHRIFILSGYSQILLSRLEKIEARVDEYKDFEGGQTYLERTRTTFVGLEVE